MIATMDWNNLNFKARDVVIFIGYLVSMVYFVSRIQSSIERQGDKMITLSEQVKEIKDKQEVGGKDYQLQYQSLQNQVNTNTSQILVIQEQLKRLQR